MRRLADEVAGESDGKFLRCLAGEMTIVDAGFRVVIFREFRRVVKGDDRGRRRLAEFQTRLKDRRGYDKDWSRAGGSARVLVDGKTAGQAPAFAMTYIFPKPARFPLKVELVTVTIA